MSFKFDIGTPIQIPDSSGAHYPGMIMAQSPSGNGDPYGDRYLIKQDRVETAVWYQRKWVDGSCFVSQLSFKEQRMEEDAVGAHLPDAYWADALKKAITDTEHLVVEYYNRIFINTDTEALHKKLDEMSKHWRPN